MEKNYRFCHCHQLYLYLYDNHKSFDNSISFENSIKHTIHYDAKFQIRAAFARTTKKGVLVKINQDCQRWHFLPERFVGEF